LRLLLKIREKIDLKISRPGVSALISYETKRNGVKKSIYYELNQNNFSHILTVKMSSNKKTCGKKIIELM
jgi:hypothetical protein